MKMFLRKMLGIVLKSVFVLISIVVLGVLCAAGIGSTLPDRYMVEKSKAFDMSVKDVWTVLYSVDQYPKWKPGVISIEELGKNDKGYLMWAELKGLKRQVSYEFAMVQYLETLGIRVTQDNAGIGGTMVIRFSEHKDNGIIHVKHFVVVKNPYYRFVMRYIEGEETLLDTFLVLVNNRLNNIQEKREAALKAAEEDAA